MKTIRSVAHIKDPYTKRILSNIINKDVFKVYSETPRLLKTLVKGLGKDQLYKPVVKGKWSIAQIISHLCDSELVMGFRYRMAISQSGSPLQAFDQNKWANRLRYRSLDCKARLDLFITMRRDNIALLKFLSPREWKQYGMHDERGKETIERMVQMETGHDVSHLRQISQMRVAQLHKKSST